jgi:ATP-dependent DNA helicase RecG
LLNALPGELAASVGALGQRHRPDEVRILVVALCRLRPWRTEELSHLLRRRPETIRQHYLRPLMRDGRLVMTNPDEPNDPQQAYRTVEASANG